MCRQCNNERCAQYRKSATGTAAVAVRPPAMPIERVRRAYRKRRRREWTQLSRVQRWRRRREGRQALIDIGVPPSALVDSRPTPHHLLPLPTAVRRKMRTTRSLRIPGEKRMADCKRLLAATCGTATASFRTMAGDSSIVGAFVTDPVRLVRLATKGSSFLAIGGDAGGGQTKLGVTYQRSRSNRTTQSFLPLLVVDAKDGRETFTALRTPNCSPFTGDSAHHADIFSVLQQLIDEHPRSFINGDWPFISALIGHKGHSSNYPCPVCIVPKQHLLAESAYRKPTDSHAMQRDSFITIPAERIVPTPLHLFLGINNRIILIALKQFLGETTVLRMVAECKTKHSAGCGGLSDLKSLNGPEITRFIKKRSAEELTELALEQRRIVRGDGDQIRRLQGWMAKLHQFLLHDEEWDSARIFRFRALVDDIHRHWTTCTGIEPFPQLHMLRHAVEFAERHGILGQISEAQIESLHAKFNALFHVQHRNTSDKPGVRLRRCLADAVLAIAAPAASTFHFQPVSKAFSPSSMQPPAIPRLCTT